MALATVITVRIAASPDDGMRGPYGSMPDSTAFPFPLERPRVGAIVPISGVVFISGLAIGNGPAGGSGGVHAVSIATGKEYWHYDRPTEPVGISLGYVVVREAEDPRTLVFIDPETARIHTRITVQGIGPVKHVLSLGSWMFFQGRDGIASIDEEGFPRSQKFPASCSPDSLLTAASDHAIAFVCRDRRHMIGFNGVELWVTDTGRLFPGGGGPRGEIYPAGYSEVYFTVAFRERPHGRVTLFRLNPTSGRVEELIATPSTRSFELSDDGDEIGVCPLRADREAVCLNKFKVGGHRRRVTEKIIWKTPLFGDRKVIDIARSGERLFVMVRGSSEYAAQLLSIDAVTGKIITQWQPGREQDKIIFTGFAPSFRDHFSLRTFTPTTGYADYLYTDDSSHIGAAPRRLFLK
ncbi:hypothetical protein [Actinomadura montaniterrae]|uniref:PQQ-binding-like beta-propeller repeat protein n=1 Tax=Actinomadura montaniterrae TaxID=1803903 RepID=A0A6L3W6A6_9ACTN|nr:hypothetical protein [Actinomadura montaniterrae]KAB2385915.1 hypothetical protein F9B16_08930 [Actinomadura montaniterrae]